MTELEEDMFRLERRPEEAVLFAHTEISPAHGWLQAAPGLLALIIPIPLCEQELDGRGWE